MKENNGQAARRQLFKKLAVVFCIFASLIGVLYAIEHQYYGQHPRERQSLFSRLRRSGRGKRRRSAVNIDRNDQQVTRILSAELNLVDIEVVSTELRRSYSDSYDGIYGIFCKLNFAVHKEDPSAVPMFRDLRAKSKRCEDTIVKFPLKDIATLARDMDEANHRTPLDSQIPKPLNVSGFVFHESRCGSTLVANTLIAMSPTRHRVYSESPPPVTALKVCGDNYDICSMEQAAMILQDTIYMMGRTNDPLEERVFFKIQSVGSRYIEVFRRAFPTTPWLFVYREPVQVMMSHLSKGYRVANCLRSLNRPPPITQQVIQRHGYHNPSQLSPEEFCAAHLATITETALSNLKASPQGAAVNYANLPGALYETILPAHMGVSVGQAEIDRILQISSQYSKGRGNRKKEWHEDSERKEEEASKVVRKAAKHFLLESYRALQTLSGTTSESEEE